MSDSDEKNPVQKLSEWTDEADQHERDSINRSSAIMYNRWASHQAQEKEEERLNLNEKPKRYALVDVNRFVEAYSDYDMTTEQAIEEVLKASIVETGVDAPLEHLTMFRVLGSDLIWRYVVAENGREACKKVKEQHGSAADDVDEYSYETIY